MPDPISHFISSHSSPRHESLQLLASALLCSPFLMGPLSLLGTAFDSVPFSLTVPECGQFFLVDSRAQGTMVTQSWANLDLGCGDHSSPIKAPSQPVPFSNNYPHFRGNMKY